jgi:hypothetical protein
MLGKGNDLGPGRHRRAAWQTPIVCIRGIAGAVSG